MNRVSISVAAKDRDGQPSGVGPDAIVSVRFRRKRDASTLFPLHDVMMTPGGDYQVFATRGEAAKAALRELAAWAVFGRLQPGGLYGDTLVRSPKAARKPSQKAA